MRDRNVTPELVLDSRQLYLLRLIGEQGACRDQPADLFYPADLGRKRNRQIKEAKAICAGCEVQDECLEYAQSAEEEEGIWGGLSEFQRRRLRRQAS